MQNTRPHEQQARNTVFQMKNGLHIIPFHEKDGTTNFSDRHLAQVFRRIVREETVNKIFYDGSIKNTADFIAFFRDKDNEIFFAEHDGNEAGFFWLNRFRHKSAFINYCFYRDFWGEKALEISRLTIDFLFARKDRHGEHCIDVLLGLTPASNKLAINFLLKNGMTVLGKVPDFLYDDGKGRPVDGIFSYRQRTGKPIVKLPSLFFVH